MKWKKVLSGVLSGALLATSVAPVSASVVEEVPAAVEVVGEADPEPVAEYSFDGTLKDSVAGTVATPVISGLTQWSKDVTYVEGRNAGKAVKLGSYGLKLNKENIGKNYTVSVWYKADGTFAENQCLLFLGYHNPEKWVAISGKTSNTSSLKVWTRDPSVSKFNTWLTLSTQTLAKSEWHCFTLSEDENGSVKTYIDGVLKDTSDGADALDGENQDIYIGVNNWDTCFSGAVDDVLVYNQTLTDEQVAAIYGTTVEAPTVESEAIATYDFSKFSQKDDEATVLTDGEKEVSLVTVGDGTAPSLVEDTDRGQVLKTVRQGTADDGLNNIGYALLSSNPFEGQSVDDGLTLNFWANTQGVSGGNRTLIDFEVAPATDGRAGTFAVNQGMLYWNTTDQNGLFTDFNTSGLGLSTQNTWKMVTVVITKEGITFYSNGKEIEYTVSSGTEDYETMINDLAGNSEYKSDSTTKVRLGASVAEYWIGAGSLLDDISFFGKALSSSEVAKLYDETATAEAATAITISGETAVELEKSTQLSVALTPADATGLSKLTWKSSNENVLTVDQTGKVQAVGTGTAKVTAQIGDLVSNELEITVSEIESTKTLDEGYYLAVYSTTTAFYASASNVDQETQSVYFAVSDDGKNFQVLNNGGGVIFSKSSEGTLKITEPKVFKSSGKFTVIARDADKTKGYHEFTSTDGVHFYDDTVVSTPSQTAGVLDKDSFTLMLDGTNILTTDSNITLGNAVRLTSKEYKYIVNKLGTVTNDGLEELEDLEIQEGDTVTEESLAESYPTVTATYTDGSTQDFNIDWTGALDGIDLTKEGTYTVTGKVNQTKYLNNLKELNGSTLPEDDPDNENTDFSTNYDSSTGTVYYDETKFIEGMADPMIYWDEETQYYYMTASYFPEDGDEIDENDNLQQYDRIVLRRGRTLEDLQDRSQQVTIWKVGNQGYTNNQGNSVSSGSRYIWAPEIHRVGDKWVIYFTESHGNGLYNIYSHALILDGDKDPYDTALTSSSGVSEWEDYQMTTNVTSSINSIGTSFCLDMTYFKDEENGTSYVIWAGKPTASYQGSSTDLFIATVDESQPWVLTSQQVRLTCSDYGWERIRYCVNEGPTVLQHDGNIFLCYSVSGTGSEYAIGMLSATNGADLLDASTWTKSPYPLLSSRDVDGEEGPGHNSFTVDKDGNVIFVYHARPTTHNYQKCGWDGTKSTYTSDPLTDPCRHARLKRVHWASDGTPILKMTYDEELTSENQTVELTVNVTKQAVEEPEQPVTPGKVTGVKATATTNKVTLTWKKAADAEKYEVVSVNTKSGKQTTIATVSGDTLKYVATGKKAATAYVYQVRAINGSAQGEYSAQVKVLTKPGKVTVKSLKKSKKNAVLKFKKVTGATNYLVYKYNAKKKAYEIAYKVQGKTLYKYTGKKYKKVGTAKLSGGVYTTTIKNIAKGKYVVKAATVKKGYKTAIGAASKAKTLK